MTEIRMGSRWVKAYDRYCVVCRKYFFALRPHGKYCSDTCKRKARKMRVNNT